jgi:hypothetical protein
MNEKAITTALLDRWRKLGTPGSLIFAQANYGAFGQVGLTRGVFDLCVIVPGLPVAFLELKTENGRLSDAQRDFQITCINAGIPQAVSYGLDEAIAILERWGAVRAAK